MKITAKEKLRLDWWLGVYAYHQSELDEHVALAYAKDVLEYQPDDLSAAWSKWRSENTKPPMPANLISIMGRRLDSETKAQLHAQNLFQCVSYYSKFGTCHPIGAEQWIRQHIGEIGWLVVQQLGGWKALWERSEKLNPEMSIGSWRKMFEVMMLSEEVNGPICLPTREEAKGFLNLVDAKSRQAGEHLE